MENIEVAIRLRPVNQREAQMRDESVWQIESNLKTISLNQIKGLQSPNSLLKQDTESYLGNTATSPRFATKQYSGNTSSFSQTVQTNQPLNSQRSTTPSNRQNQNHQPKNVNVQQQSTNQKQSNLVAKSKSPISQRQTSSAVQQQSSQTANLVQQKSQNQIDKSPQNQSKQQNLQQQQKQRDQLKSTMDKITSISNNQKMKVGDISPQFSQNNSFIISNSVLQKVASQSSLQSANFQSDPKKKLAYNFDLCFKEPDTNHQIYQQMVKRIALSSLNGINGTVFMYGQTGSGKTYTMLGRERKEIIPFFNQLQNQQSQNFTNKQTHPQYQNQSKIQAKGQDQKSQARDKSINSLQDSKPVGLGFVKQNFNSYETNTGEDINIEMSYLSGKSQEKLAGEKSNEQPGVLIYAFQDIFNEINNDQEKTYFLRCSYIEIYNEQVYDLLRTEDSMLSEPLHLNEDKNKDFYIRGVIEEPVTSIDEILYYLRRGELNRHYAETKLNHSSSRSHTLFRLQVQSITNNFLQQEQSNQLSQTLIGNTNSINQNDISPSKSVQISNQINSINSSCKDIKKYVTQSVLNFVDLAGSEKVSSHYDNKDPDELFVTNFGDQTPQIDMNVKNRVTEGKNINKSLFFLTQVISMRAEQKSLSLYQQLTNSNQKSPQNPQQHIPYRNSPLTKILRSSLGGNSRTCVIICVTPVKSQTEQTLSSLRFGQNAMKIENKVQANIISNNNEEAVKILIADYERKIKSLEKAKRDVQKQREQESRIIEQLIEEKKKLIEKLTNNNVKKLNQSMQLNILDQYIQKDIYDQEEPQKQQILMQGVGLLEISQNLIQKVSTKKQMPAQSQIDLKQSDFGVYQLRSQIKLQKLVCTVQSTQIDLQREQIQSLVDCISELKSKNHHLESQLSQATELITQKLTQLHIDESNFKLLKMKEQFYECFNKGYLRTLELDQVSNLEKQMGNCQEMCKKELMKREYREKIKFIQDQVLKLKGQRGGVDESKDQQFSAIEILLSNMQVQSQEQSRVEGYEIDRQDDQEDLCELHKNQVQFQQSMVEYSNRKNNIISHLQDVQNQISLSINENSYMNQVSEENQRKVNAIIARQNLINKCEDKISKISSKFKHEDKPNNINQNSKQKSSRKNKSSVSLSQTQNIVNQAQRSVSNFKVSQESHPLRSSQQSQKQTISLSPRLIQKDLKNKIQQNISNNQIQIYNVKAKNQSKTIERDQVLQKQFATKDKNQSESELQISQSFNQAIKQYDNLNLKLRNTYAEEIANHYDLDESSVTEMSCGQLTSTFNQNQSIHQQFSNDFRSQRNLQNCDQQIKSIGSSEGFAQFGIDNLQHAKSVNEKDCSTNLLILESFANTFRESHPDMALNNLFETLHQQQNFMLESGEVDEIQPQMIINLNDYVSFKKQSTNKKDKIVKESEDEIETVTSFKQQAENKQVIHLHQPSSQSDDSRYESAEHYQLKNSQYAHHQNQKSFDSQGVLSLNVNKLNQTCNFLHSEQDLKNSIQEASYTIKDASSFNLIANSLRSSNQVLSSCSNENTLCISQAHHIKSVQFLNQQQFAENITQQVPLSSRNSAATIQLNQKYSNIQHNQSQNQTNSSNNTTLNNSKSMRLSLQPVIGKKAEMKEYQPLLSNRNSNSTHNSNNHSRFEEPTKNKNLSLKPSVTPKKI